ncbi:hypothetical protein [Laceyella putida]|uniref:XRE family transcriptional regulator n=1 Tax=Laceyella putida TaxID=110101 RepID=A0ABW2REW6_9BACL
MDPKLIEEAKARRLYNHKGPIVKTGNNVDEVLKEIDETQMGAALKTGIPQAILSRWDKAEKFNPDFIASILIASGKDFFDLFPIVEKRDKPEYMDQLEKELDKEKPGG